MISSNFTIQYTFIFVAVVFIIMSLLYKLYFILKGYRIKKNHQNYICIIQNKLICYIFLGIFIFVLLPLFIFSLFLSIGIVTQFLKIEIWGILFLTINIIFFLISFTYILLLSYYDKFWILGIDYEQIIYTTDKHLISNIKKMKISKLSVKIYLTNEENDIVIIYFSSIKNKEKFVKSLK